MSIFARILLCVVLVINCFGSAFSMRNLCQNKSNYDPEFNFKEVVQKELSLTDKTEVVCVLEVAIEDAITGVHASYGSLYLDWSKFGPMFRAQVFDWFYEVVEKSSMTQEDLGALQKEACVRKKKQVDVFLKKYLKKTAKSGRVVS